MSRAFHVGCRGSVSSATVLKEDREQGWTTIGRIYICVAICYAPCRVFMLLQIWISSLTSGPWRRRGGWGSRSATLRPSSGSKCFIIIITMPLCLLLLPLYYMLCIIVSNLIYDYFCCDRHFIIYSSGQRGHGRAGARGVPGGRLHRGGSVDGEHSNIFLLFLILSKAAWRAENSSGFWEPSGVSTS